MRIGFVGLGTMGRAMVRNLIKSNHEITVWARDPNASAVLAEAGAKVASSLADVTVDAEAVITIVGDSDDAEQVWLSENGLMSNPASGWFGIDMTTTSPDIAKKIGQQLSTQNICFLDAPVSGGEMSAIQGTLSIMVGGEEKCFAKARPIFTAMGKSVVLVGNQGMGQITKAANQILTGIGTVAVAEALNFARIMGADSECVREALLGGFAYSKILEDHGRRMLDRNFVAGFKARLHQKDMRIVMECAHEKNMTLPVSAAAEQMFNALVGSGYGEDDSISVLKLFESLHENKKI